MRHVTIAASVAKGAELLDRIEPGWFRKIDPFRLNMNSCLRCILGQLYGHVRRARLYTDAPTRSPDFGFDFNDYSDNAKAQAAWIEEIERRTTEATPCP